MKRIFYFLLLALSACSTSPQLNEEVENLFVSPADLAETGMKFHPSVRKSLATMVNMRDSHTEMIGEYNLQTPEGGAGVLTTVVISLKPEANKREVFSQLLAWYRQEGQDGKIIREPEQVFSYGDLSDHQDYFIDKQPSGQFFLTLTGNKGFLFLSHWVVIPPEKFSQLLKLKMELLEQWDN